MAEGEQTFGWEDAFRAAGDGMTRAASLVQMTPEHRVLLATEPWSQDIIGTREDMEMIARALAQYVATERS